MRATLVLFSMCCGLLAQSVPNDVQAFVPTLHAVKQVEPEYPREARSNNVQGIVELLVTIDRTGAVANAEALSGREVLRSAAVDSVRQWKFQPVIREGQSVRAMTTALVSFSIPGVPGRLDDMGAEEDVRAANQRFRDLEVKFPRSAQQVLADLENSIESPTEIAKMSRALAKAAFRAGDFEKAADYAKQALTLAESDGGFAHDGNSVLGLIALKNGDVEAARTYLLKAGQTQGGPSLNSFGPNMMLAEALLEAGESAAVLQYFTECRSFWKTKKIDQGRSWSGSGASRISEPICSIDYLPATLLVGPRWKGHGP